MLIMSVLYLAVAIPFLALDAVWLSIMSQVLYKPVLGDILRGKPNLWAAAVFYLLYPAGLAFFAVLPSLGKNSLTQAAGTGLLFGFFTYATYDLTNQATLRNWSTTLTLADLAWGSALAACCSAIAYLVIQKMFGT